MPSLGEGDYDIYTDDPGAFKGHRVTRITPSDEKQKIVKACHGQSIASKRPTVIACPDMVFGTGTLDVLQSHADAGTRLVLAPSPRLNRPAMLPYLQKSFANNELTALAMQNLHPGMEMLFWDAIPFTDTPYQIYWRHEQGLTVRCFHMHPLLVWMQDRKHFSGTVDDDCVDLFKTDQAHVVTDSDEIACFELSNPGYQWSQKPGDRNNLKHWVNRKTNRMHRWFFKHECYIGMKNPVETPKELEWLM